MHPTFPTISAYVANPDAFELSSCGIAFKNAGLQCETKILSFDELELARALEKERAKITQLYKLQSETFARVKELQTRLESTLDEARQLRAMLVQL